MDTSLITKLVEGKWIVVFSLVLYVFVEMVNKLIQLSVQIASEFNLKALSNAQRHARNNYVKH